MNILIIQRNEKLHFRPSWISFNWKKGTEERDEYEFELKLELVGDMIKTARKKRKLTQEQLGELVGVKKAQISRLENSTGNVTFETVMRIINALGAKLTLNLQI